LKFPALAPALPVAVPSEVQGSGGSGSAGPFAAGSLGVEAAKDSRSEAPPERHPACKLDAPEQPATVGLSFQPSSLRFWITREIRPYSIASSGPIQLSRSMSTSTFSSG